MSEYNMGVLGLVLGVIGILAGVASSYYFYLRGREVADPRYLLQCSPLLLASSEVADRMKFFYDGKEVTNLNSCTVILWNRGRRPIPGAAIVAIDPLRVEMPRGCRAIAVDVEPSRRAINMSAELAADGAQVLISFDFLDMADGGSIEIMYQGESGPKPVLAGALRGSPAGFQLPPFGLHLGDDEEEADADDVERDTDTSFRGWRKHSALICA